MNSQAQSNKRFYIHTLGCKVNQYESQAIRESLLKAGYKECLARDIADVIIINTCTVTEHADKESRHLIGLFHRANPKAKIAVTGCYAENNADNISFIPGVAYIIPNEYKCIIDKIIEGTASDDDKSRCRSDLMAISDFRGRTKAFLKIQDGCENRCAYCKVALIRGPLRSKPIDNIIKEARSLVANGYKEIVLAGICLGAWGKDLYPYELSKSVGIPEAGVLDVLKALDKIEGDFRIRLSSIEPKYVTDELINYIAGNKRICRHLHIPLQSGDDEILKRMNRNYTTAQYGSLVARVKDAIEGVAVSTDIMVGFPGESESNFNNTVNFLKSVMPARTHIFTYSKRDGTAASLMPEEVPVEVAKRRYHALKTSTLMLAYLYRSKFIGLPLRVLVESKRDKNSGMLVGYTDNYIRMIFNGPDEIMGKLVAAKIDEINLTCSVGTLVENESLKLS